MNKLKTRYRWTVEIWTVWFLLCSSYGLLMYLNSSEKWEFEKRLLQEGIVTQATITYVKLGTTNIVYEFRARGRKYQHHGNVEDAVIGEKLTIVYARSGPDSSRVGEKLSSEILSDNPKKNVGLHLGTGLLVGTVLTFIFNLIVRSIF